MDFTFIFINEIMNWISPQEITNGEWGETSPVGVLEQAQWANIEGLQMDDERKVPRFYHSWFHFPTYLALPPAYQPQMKGTVNLFMSEDLENQGETLEKTPVLERTLPTCQGNVLTIAVKQTI